MSNAAKGGGFALAFAFAVLLIPAALGSSTTIFNDGDVSWHIATGQWILDHGAIPGSDPFSFTWFGQPWVPIEWLAEVAMAGAYRLAGYSGIAALVTLALIALHALLFLNASRFVHPFAAAGIVVATDVVLIPMMLARPHLVAWALVAGWTWLMLRAREADRAPPLAAALLITSVSPMVTARRSTRWSRAGTSAGRSCPIAMPGCRAARPLARLAQDCERPGGGHLRPPITCDVARFAVGGRGG